MTIDANGYTIYFNQHGYAALNEHLLAANYSKIFILVDNNTNDNCLPQLLQKLETELVIEIIEIESGEAAKTIETCVGVWNALTELGADRKSILLNLGGGVISDLGGFVASTYKRGIDFIHIPTTLLGMVDASVGGKNGVDLGALKNQIGVINVPRMVLIDTGFLETLPQAEMRSGLAEMLKHGLIADADYWKQFLDLSLIDFADFDTLVIRSVEIKNAIVSQDPTENGIRKALNFGHTLGHAIESFFLESETRQTLLHGEAIAIGMILESHISLANKLISSDEYLMIKSTILGIFGKIDFSDDELEPILELLIHDKKNEYGQIQFVLLDRIGAVRINQMVPNILIMSAFADYQS